MTNKNKFRACVLVVVSMQIIGAILLVVTIGPLASIGVVLFGVALPIANHLDGWLVNLSTREEAKR